MHWGCLGLGFWLDLRRLTLAICLSLGLRGAPLRLLPGGGSRRYLFRMRVFLLVSSTASLDG